MASFVPHNVLRFTHVVAWISNSLLVNSKHYYMSRSQLIYSSIHGHLGGNKLLVITTNVGKNTSVCFLCLWQHLLLHTKTKPQVSMSLTGLVPG